MSKRRRSIAVALGTIAPVVLVVALAVAQGPSPAPKPLPRIPTVAEGSNSAEAHAQAAAERDAAADESGWKHATRPPAEAGRIDVCTGKRLEPGAPVAQVSGGQAECDWRGADEAAIAIEYECGRLHPDRAVVRRAERFLLDQARTRPSAHLFDALDDSFYAALDDCQNLGDAGKLLKGLERVYDATPPPSRFIPPPKS